MTSEATHTPQTAHAVGAQVDRPVRPGAGAPGPWKVKALVLLNKNDVPAVKRKIGYEEDVPRCKNCKAFAKAQTQLINSLPIRTPDTCKRYRLLVQPDAVCNNWHSKVGNERLA